jgi:MoaA/NifB/PqqE/SkfB family radical SAM enzyme
VKCLHCYYAHSNDNSFTSLDCLKKEVDQAIERGNNYIDFTGGEPSIYPQMPELIRYCTEKGLGTCIITNGIAGANTVRNIMEAGLDDWLISVHGTEETHNTIVQLKDARERQIRFIKQIKLHDGKFRFNCTLTKYNQSELIDIAKWAAQMKPYIFNFINFNPHHEWQNDIEGTQKVIADLNIVESNINEAIAILEDASIGVNVRYYPMCRINEEYRRCICNDLQVMFDPYEWDYSITPKNYQSYYRAGVNLSNQNEWKGQPCQSCDLRYICGGLNSAFHRASGMKSIKSIKDTSVIRDDIYHYRRKNITTITDKKNSAELCIAAIVDENMADFIPLFLYTAFKSFPDYDIKVFGRFEDSDVLRNMVDQHVGYGFYDSCVLQISHELTEYNNTPNVTRSIRFIEFQKYLEKYNYVLFTDIDMLFVNETDFVNRHTEQMKTDGTECYENWLTIHNGIERLSGVHFITKEWWSRTAEQRKLEGEKLKTQSSVDWDYDEKMLLRIVTESKLKVSPAEKRIWRHHAIHLGDIEFAIKNRSVYTFSEQKGKAITDYLADKSFADILKQTVSRNDRFRAIEHVLNNGLDAVETQNAQNITPVKKKFDIKHYDGSLCVFTICDETYQWYVPLFLKSIETIKTEQKITPVVFIRGNVDPEMIELCKGNAQYIYTIDDHYGNYLQNTEFPSGGYTTAAMRYLLRPETTPSFGVKKFAFENSDYTLITDIDILFYKETMTIIDQHMMHLVRDNTVCFENWVSEYRGECPRLPGVHFVTKEWWSRTEKAREKCTNKVMETGTINEYWFDELMLGQIVKESGLPLPPAEAKLWRHHGVHLGDWRLNIERKQLPRPNVFELMHIQWMLTDPEMSILFDECGKRIKLIADVKKMWPGLFK